MDQLSHICQTYLPKTLIAKIAIILQKKTTKTDSPIVRRKRRAEDDCNANIISDFLGDFNIQQLSQLWQKITEVFDTVTNSVNYSPPKRTRTE